MPFTTLVAPSEQEELDEETQSDLELELHSWVTGQLRDAGIGGDDEETPGGDKLPERGEDSEQDAPSRSDLENNEGADGNDILDEGGQDEGKVDGDQETGGEVPPSNQDEGNDGDEENVAQ